MKTSTWIGGILALSLCACGGPKGYVIQGELTGIPDSTTLYLIDANNLQIMDSALMIGGHFRMENQLTEEPGDLRLRAILQPNGTQINLRLLIGNESIRIKGDISDFPYHVKVSGSKYQKQWDDFAQATLKYDLQADSLIKAFRNLPAETRDQNRFGEQLHSIYQITDSIKQDYILHHPNSFPGLIHLQYNMWKFPKDTLQMLFEQMPPSLKSHSFAKPIQTFITCEKVEEGDRFLDFEAEDQNGHRVRLSDWAGKKRNIFCWILLITGVDLAVSPSRKCTK